MKSIINGIRKYQSEVHPKQQALFEQLSTGQSPTALIISCADSRVDLGMVTQSEPGQLFFFRNAGNIIPPYGAMLGAVSATIEYAMTALKIPNIIVCGHSDCGAMKGVLSPEIVKGMPTVAQWLKFSDAARATALRNAGVPSEHTLEQLTEENVLSQLANLATHPSVASRLANGEVELHGWVYDIKSGGVKGYDAADGRFVPITREPMPHATPENRRHRAR